MSSARDHTQPRCVMMWSVPRTLSTVFCKCISAIPGVQMFFEPYLSASIFGPERLPPDTQSRFDDKYLQYYSEQRILHEAPKIPAEETRWFPADACTYDWVKQQLITAATSDAKMIICKDIAMAVTGHYESIPNGYQHVILIRNPYKNIASYKRMCCDHMGFTKEEDAHVNFRDMPQRLTGHKPTYGYQDLIELYQYLQKNHGNHHPVVIIDADDLQNHTASILRQLLEDVIGIPYDERYLNWNNSSDISKQWVMSKVFGYKSLIEQGTGVHAKGLMSTSFEPAKTAPSRDSLTEDLREAVDAALPIYEELYKLRLRP